MNREKKMRVCYRSGTLEHPNLTVLYDNATDAVTLVDYPHYDGLDWSNDPDLTYGTIRERYEKRLSGAYNDEREVALDEEEYACLMNVLNIVIPAGVDSIDVKKFIESSTENGNNTRRTYRRVLTILTKARIHITLHTAKVDCLTAIMESWMAVRMTTDGKLDMNTMRQIGRSMSKIR